jgi:hypothetical protein
MTTHSEQAEDSPAEDSPARPADPVQPGDPVRPGEDSPAQPGDPVQPAEDSPAEDSPAQPADPVQPGDPVQRWVGLGIITAEQAAAIRADQAATASARATAGTTQPSGQGLPGTSLVAEALGYLGGVIILVGLGLAAGWFWPDLSAGVRLALTGVVAAALLFAGLVVPVEAGRAAALRLRSVLWLLSVTALAGFLALFADDVLGWTDERQAAFASAGSALLSALLWWRHHHLLLHLALLVSLVVAAGTSTSLLTAPGTAPSACVWAVGVAWYLLGWGGVLRPRREVELAGAAAAVFGTALVAVEPWGSPLALSTLTVLAVLAVRLRDLPLLVVTALATLVDLPAIVNRYFHGLLSAAAVLLVVGGLLVATALVAVRRPGPDRAPAGPPWNGGTATQGAVAAAVVLSVTFAVVLVVAPA